MKTCTLAPLVVVVLALVWPAGADKPPSLVSSLLDLLPEIEELSGGQQTGPEISSTDSKKAEEAIEIFSLFTPFIRNLITERAKEDKTSVPEDTLKSLDTMERIIPKFLNVVVALASRSKSNPDDEPLLADFTGLVPRGRYGAPRQSRPKESDETPKLDKAVISDVLQQSTKLISQITAARASAKSDSDEAPSRREEAAPPTNYYISSETTRRPATRKRRPSTQRSYTTTPAPRVEEASSEEEAPTRSYSPRPAYTAPTTAAPAPRDDSDESPTVRTYSTSTRVTSGSQPGSSVSFFTLPTSRSSRRQRVTRGSDYQVKPQRYFYLE